ncbi:hypothetical protein Tco_1377712, partial [Tanacetum coccineum]
VAFVSENIEALENVVEDKPHFLTDVVDNHLMEKVVPWREEAVVGYLGDVGGVEKISLTRSKLIANGEVCLDDCDGDGGGEVNGEGVVLGVFKRRLEDIPGKVIGERGGDTIGLDGGVVNYYGLLAGNRLNLEGKSRTCSLKFILQCTGSAGFADSIYRMELAFVSEGNQLSVVDSKQC